MLRESTCGAEPTSFQPSAPEGGEGYRDGAAKEEKPSPRDESKGDDALRTKGYGLDH